MTLQELYAEIDGNYQEVLGRMRMDKLIDRFIVKFLDDTSCQRLIDVYDNPESTIRQRFDAAHSAKGVTANLSLTKLSKLASDVCECFRYGNEKLRAETDVDGLMDEFRVCYAHTVETIQDYAAAR